LKNSKKLLLALLHLSICTEQCGYHWTDFHEILHEDLLKIYKENSGFIKI